MKTRVVLVALCIGLFALASTSSRMAEGYGLDVPAAPAEALGTGITYQGQLADASGPVNGSYDFRFIIYDLSIGGSQVGLIVEKNDIAVSAGLFTVELDFGPAVFTGAARWLEVGVRPGASPSDYVVLSPRQKLTAAPYALNAEKLDGVEGAGYQLRVTGVCAAGYAIRGVNADGTVTCELVDRNDHSHWGASWSGDGFGLRLTGTGIALEGRWGAASSFTPVASAIWGDSSVYIGVVGTSETGVGVLGRSNGANGVAGATYSTSALSAGVRGTSYDAAVGVYGSSSLGVAVYGNSATSIYTYGGYFSGPAGAYTVAEVDSADGLRSSCPNGGTCYGVYAYSASSNAIYAYTGNALNNYGLYTPDNIYSANYHTSTGLALVAQNGGVESLQVGDLVAVTGVGAPLPGTDTPLLQVRRASGSDLGGVVGVLQSAFRVEMVVKTHIEMREGELLAEAAAEGSGERELIPVTVEEQVPVQVPVEWPAQPGDMLIIQVQGLAQVRVSAEGGAIHPGDLLSLGAGGAAQRAEPSLSVDATTLQYSAGTILGQALEAWDSGDGLIWVLVNPR